MTASDDLLTLLQTRSAELSENLWAEGDEALLAGLASIPAEPDHDVDLLLVEAADRIRVLEEKIRHGHCLYCGFDSVPCREMWPTETKCCPECSHAE